MELTKKRTPHHHLVVGPVEGEIACYGDRFEIKAFVGRMGTCDCLSHRFSVAWQAVTGDSFICHATAVVGAAKAASYMAKYMVKTFGMEGRFKAMGMERRWSSSRGWPGTGQVRLAYSESAGGPGWERIEFHGRSASDEELAKTPEDLLVRVGDPGTIALLAKQKSAALARRIVRRLRQ